MIFWLGMVLFIGCRTAGTEVGKAVMLEQEGDSVAAFDIYTSVMQTYPNSSEAEMSLRRVQRMQLKTAKAMEKVDPNRAVILYRSMQERWPNTGYARIATEKIARLTRASSTTNALTATTVQTGKDPIVTDSETIKETKDKSQEAIENAIDNVNNALSIEDRTVSKDDSSSLMVDEVERAEWAACDTARQSKSRVVWQQYKQTFPTGVCIEEAEGYLRVVAPRQMEVDQAKSKASKAQKALISLCSEYRLVQTTSNPKACSNPSQALMTEFARLQKRKSDLLSSDEAEKIEYYAKWIPPRWNKLSMAESKACGDLLTFVEELNTQGIDRDALESELTMVRTCFVEQGAIDE